VFLFRFTYRFAWFLITPILVFLTKYFIKKWQSGLPNRLGRFFYPDGTPMDFIPYCVWFHAVSVGEFNALYPVLEYFRGTPLVLSVGTETAHTIALKKLAEEIENNQIRLIYMPWDNPEVINRTLERIRPIAIVLTETELWPALIDKASQMSIRICVINARLSDSSFSSYNILKIFIPYLFRNLSLVLAQSNADAKKFRKLGTRIKNIKITGNIKFGSLPFINKENSNKLKSKFGYDAENIVLIAVSTHPEEEAKIISIHQELKEKYPQLRLILAPRHPERFEIVKDLIQSAAKLQTIQWSQIKAQVESYAEFEKFIQTSNDVLLVDTLGDLVQIFLVSDIAFVGGTLVEKIGGHNVLEPAAAALPVLVGPHYHKNIETVEILEKAQALYVAETLEEMRNFIERLIQDSGARVVMGANGRDFIQKNRRILKDSAEILRDFVFSNPEL
jgi:3-deoxy-D-manno-octulosonic-acid transferase